MAACVGLTLGFSLVVVRAGLALVGNTRPFLAVVSAGGPAAVEDSTGSAAGVVLLGDGVNR